MTKSYLLGIDIGTSACKVAVFDREGKVLAAANGDYPVYYPQEGWQNRIRKNGGAQSVKQQKKLFRKQGLRRRRLPESESMVRAGQQSPLTKRVKSLPTHQSGWIPERSQSVTG